MKQQIVITAVGRSGGSMLARLFDGHPMVACYPFEPRFGYIDPELHRKFSESFEGRLSGTLAEILRKYGRLERFERIVLGFSPSKHVYLEYDADAFRRNLERHLPANATPAEFRDLVSQAFFCCSEFYSGRWDQIAIIAWHSVYSHYWNREYLADGSTKLIYLIRHPLDVAASMLLLKGGQRSLNLEFEVMAWLDCLFRGIMDQAAHTGRVRLVRYEDLVRDVCGTMKQLAEFIGVEDHPSLNGMSIYGRTWLGSSSFNSPTSISTETFGRFIKVLDKSTVARLWCLCGGAAETMGYQLTNPIAALEPIPISPDIIDWQRLSRDFYMSYCRNYRKVRPKNSRQSDFLRQLNALWRSAGFGK